MDKKKIIGLVTLIIGILALIAGIVILVINLLAEPATRDAEYLVEIGAWSREDAPGVVWDFTEIGKGTLTTNNHVNDYDFIWSLEDGKLKIETAWLYDLNNEYDYQLNQTDSVLTLMTGNEEESVNINFHPASSVDAEVTEDN